MSFDSASFQTSSFEAGRWNDLWRPDNILLPIIADDPTGERGRVATYLTAGRGRNP